MTQTTYDLAFPIDLNGQTIKNVTLRRPKGNDLVAAQRASTNELERSMALVERLAEFAPGTCGEMDALDVDALATLVGGMMGNGKKPSV